MVTINSLSDRIEDLKVSGALFHNRWYSYGELLDMLKSGKLQFISDEPLIKWSANRRRCYLESLLLFPTVDTFVIDGAEKEWYVVNGEEKLRALKSLSEGKINSLPFTVPSDGRGLDKGSVKFLWDKKVRNSKASVSIISPGTTKLQRYWIYANMFEQQGEKDEFSFALKIFEEEIFPLENWRQSKHMISSVKEIWSYFVYRIFLSNSDDIGLAIEKIPLQTLLGMSLVAAKELEPVFHCDSNLSNKIDKISTLVRDYKSSNNRVTEIQQACLFNVLVCLDDDNTSIEILKNYVEAFKELWKEVKTDKFKGYTVGSHRKRVDYIINKIKNQ